MLELAFRPEPFTPRGGCRCEACRNREVDEPLDELFDEWEMPDWEVSTANLRDIVVDLPAKPGVWGVPSSQTNPATTNKRCKTEHACPKLVDLRAVKQVSGVPFEYIGGTEKKEGLIWGKTSKKWLVNESARGLNRTIHILPRSGDAIANFLANMKAVGLDIECLLTMGSLNCRCISGTDRLSDHSNGDAYDFGGLRLVGGREVLVANATCVPADRAILHRANACLRLSFSRVLDYHHIIPFPYECGTKTPKFHWNHIHCDTNQGKPLRWYTNPRNVNWRYVRESLGLKITGGLDQECKDALRAFAGADAFKSARHTALALQKLYMREATKT